MPILHRQELRSQEVKQIFPGHLSGIQQNQEADSHGLAPGANSSILFRRLSLTLRLIIPDLMRPMALSFHVKFKQHCGNYQLLFSLAFIIHDQDMGAFFSQVNFKPTRLKCTFLLGSPQEDLSFPVMFKTLRKPK